MSDDFSQGFRLSPQQQRLWVLQQELSSSPFYTRCSVLIDGSLNISQLKMAVEHVVAKYEILRTVFQSLPYVSFPLQVISDKAVVSWQQQDDLSHLTAEEQECRIATLFQQPISFDAYWTHGPLVHMSLIPLAPCKSILFITLPAMCADTTTLNTLVYEIGSSYEMLEGGTRNDATDQEIFQYVDYAEWRNELLIEGKSKVGREYWLQQRLADLFTSRLPSEKQPIGKTFALQIFAAALSSDASTKLHAVASHYDISDSAFLLTCWQILLWRLTERSPTIIGVNFDGRTHEELQNVPGLFTQYLPLCADMDGENAFIEVAKDNHQEMEQMYEQQGYFSWQQVDDPLSPSIQVPYCPLSFAFEKQGMSYQTTNTSFTLLHQYSCSDRFHLKLLCCQHENGFRLEFCYDADLLPYEAVTCIAEQFTTLVKSALHSPDACILSLEIVGGAERERLLSDFNRTQEEFPPHTSILDTFAEQARQHPHTVAVVFEEEHLTYAELQRCAIHLAYHLRGLGVVQETRVGIYMERSVECVIGLLGTLLAGGCYVPLDPEYPDERLDFMLEDAQIQVLITQERLQRKFACKNKLLVCLDTWTWLENNGEGERKMAAEITGEMIAYVIYTSGSTGQPKGVMLPHSALANHMAWMQKTVPLVPADRVLQKTSMSFDASVWEFFAPLLAGAQLIVAFPYTQQDGSVLIEAIRRYDITILQVVPSLLRLLLFDEQGFKSCQSLRRVFCGGEKLTEDLQRQFLSYSKANFYNLYGPTECCVDATSWESKREDGAQKVFIGRPIANTQVYILDADQQLAPIGVVGELYIGGAGLARGYLQRPDATAERFIPDPFNQQEGKRLYRTGDVGRFLPDGTIEYVGRTDHQVKLRGFRIELGEIASVLERFPPIEKAVALVKDVAPDEQQLMVYLAPSKQYALTVQRLLDLEKRNHLPRQQYYELPNGMGIICMNRSETGYIYKEIFQDQEYLKHGISFHEGDCIFDVGANIGMFTLFASRMCGRAIIYAFEPIPAVCDVLRLNASLYNLDARVFECGMSRKRETVSFTFYPHITLMSSRYANPGDEKDLIQLFLANQQQIETEETDLYREMIENRLHGEQISCQLRTISEIIHEYDVKRIDLLKIDAEKSEMEVLEGISEEDWPKIKQLVIEVHDIENRLDKIKARLIQRGYTVALEQEATLEGTNLYNLFAIHQSANWEKPEKNTSQKEHMWFSSGALIRDTQAYLSEKLPTYMLPSHYTLVNEWPLTPNGKIDHKALPEPGQNVLEQDVMFFAPRTELETSLAEIWAKVLKIGQVGVYTNFFRAGGHSLLVTQIISRVNEVFGVKLPMRSLFERPTLAEFAQYLEEVRQEKS